MSAHPVLLPTRLLVRVSDSACLAYEITSRPPRRVLVGEEIPPEFPSEMGIDAKRLRDRHLGFVLLLNFDPEGTSPPRMITGRGRRQRQLFADQLGIRPETFRKWLELNLAKKPGLIIRWGRPGEFRGHEPSRTGGPWWLAVKEREVVPDDRRGLEYIDRLAEEGLSRQTDPGLLVEEARRERDLNNWEEALLLLGEAREMYRRRDWNRKDPLWFDINLSLAQAQMQLGMAGPVPQFCYDIVRSVGYKDPGGTTPRIVRAEAYHIAALVRNQHHDLTRAVEDLKRAQAAVRSSNDPNAVQELWKLRSYQESVEARSTRSARTRAQSQILQAGRILPGRREESRMRYGETLLCANRPGMALEYIVPALESGRLSTQAQVIAERLTLQARWSAGARPDPILAGLEELESKARSLGFRHEVRLIGTEKRSVRKKIRSAVGR